MLCTTFTFESLERMAGAPPPNFGTLTRAKVTEKLFSSWTLG